MAHLPGSAATVEEGTGTPGRLFIFDTHPIQYRSPVFRALHLKLPGLKVFFLNDHFDSSPWWLSEKGQIPKQEWNLPLKEGFPNRTLGTKKLGIWGSYRALDALLEKEKPAAIALYGYYQVEHWILRWLSARHAIPLLFIGETFSVGEPSLRRSFKLPLMRFFFRGVKNFIAIGKKTWTHYRSLGIPEARISQARYCTDVGFFQLEPDDAAATRLAWRRKLGIPEEAFVLLFVGRFAARKRPEDVIRLHERLKANTLVYTVLVGNGPLEAALHDEANQSARVIFTGFQDQAATRAAYHGSDCLLVTSASETWGLVVNEAFACSLPALVTSTCGVADDLVVPGETGFVFEPGDLKALVTYCQRLIRDRGECQRLGASAKRKVTTEYDVEQFAEAMFGAFRQVAR